MFAVLTYTDCASDDSVSGRAGFQFQAESPSATPTDEDRISRGLLHVVPLGLDPERPADHPPTCAYLVHDERFYLSRGRSTGRTLSGRPGNQVTETIVTDAVADILPLRPAQLFSASSWTLEPAQTQEIADWHAPLEIDPAFETARLHEMVAADPWGRQMLPAFMTMVEQATASPSTKLILAHRDQLVVMRWISLASLFEDGATALNLTFRVYSANPMAEPVQIVGAHPSLSPDLTPATTVGCNLVDLERQLTTDVQISPSAAMHAAWFLEHDPYEALDAVETSRRWAARLPSGDAALAASVACLDGSQHAEQQKVFQAALAALDALAAAGQHDELEAYGEALVDTVSYRPPHPDDDIEQLVRAMWQLSAAGEDDLATGVALAGLEWAVKLPSASAAWARSNASAPAGAGRQRLRWSDKDAAAHAADLVSRALAASADADLPAWFALAKALATGISQEQAADSTARLAALWAARPELTATAHDWVHLEAVTAALEKELHVRLQAGHPPVLDALSHGSWDWLIGDRFALDPAGRPMSVWLACRTLDSRHPADRVDLIERVAPHLPDSASVVLLERRAGRLTTEELVAWLQHHRTVSPGMAQLVEDHLDRLVSERRREPIDRLATAVAVAGVSGLTRRCKGTIADYDRLRRLVEEAQRELSAASNPRLHSAAALPTRLLVLYADELAELLMHSGDEEAIRAIAESARDELAEPVERAVRRLVAEGNVWALYGTLRLRTLDERGLGRAAGRALAKIWTDPQYDTARATLTEQLSEDWQPLLADFEASLKSGLTKAFKGVGQLLHHPKDRA